MCVRVASVCLVDVQPQAVEQALIGVVQEGPQQQRHGCKAHAFLGVVIWYAPKNSVRYNSNNERRRFII
tara:strand:- start:2878 stop:3084 length:207 start_codon:yes stop_codon:yes gene_type:complete